MERIDGANTIVLPGGGAGFQDRNLTAGIPGTTVTAKWANNVQEELVSILTAAGIALDGANYGQVLAALDVLFAKPRSIQVFSASGTFTVPAGVTRLDVELVGGGGGGGGNNGTMGAGCGGAGGYARKIITGLTPGAAIAVTVGAQGAAGASGANDGGNGGTTSFGAYLSATGGIGGASTSSNAGGAGGVGIGGDVVVAGSYGSDGAPGTTVDLNGVGGSSFFGGAGRHGFGVGIAAGGFGSGGGGAYGSAAAAGGVGGSGLVVVRW